MAMYTLKFDFAPLILATDNTTGTGTFYCCNVSLGAATSPGAASASVYTYAERSFDITAHLLERPQAMHYPSFHYSSGSHGVGVKNLRIERSTGEVWRDQYGPAGITAMTGYDAASTASQLDMAASANVGSFSRVDYRVTGIDLGSDYPEWWVVWEQAPDPVNNADTNTASFSYRPSAASAYGTAASRVSELAESFVKTIIGETQAWAQRSMVVTTPLADPLETRMQFSYTSGGDGLAVRNFRLHNRYGSIAGVQAGSHPSGTADFTGAWPATLWARLGWSTSNSPIRY